MNLRNKLDARKATWLAFGLVALAGASSHEGSLQAQTTLPEVADTQSLHNVASQTAHTNAADPASTGASSSNGVDGTTNLSQKELDQAAEAARAYRQALATLAALTSHAASNAHAPTFVSGATSNSFLSAFLPNLQGQGPLGSIVRIALKLHQQSWLRRFTSDFVRETLGLGATRKRDEDLRGRAVKVVDLLQHSAELGYSDALYVLAQISLFPPTDHFASNPALAYRTLQSHVAQTGNGTSQALLAFFHATGYHGVIPVDQARAQLYYTFAAHNGDKGAQMALGYRSWTGIGTLEDCGRAVEWYETAAEQAIAKFLSGPPGGRTLPQTPTRLSDLAGGVYGPGASVASTGMNTQRPAIKAGVARAAGETWEDVLEYYLFNADRGETDFAYRLGKIFYQGSIYATPGGIASGSEGVGSVPRDFQHARYYFLRIARQVWPRDPPHPQTPIKEDSHAPVGYAAASAAYLGRMYLRGEGVRADAAIAKMWFERGAEHGDRECHNGLGIIWRDGLVQGRRDIKKALAHFSAAAGQELAEAQVNLGKHYYALGELKLAMTYFETAIRHGSPFEAYYYLGEIHAAQVRAPGMAEHLTASSCAMAVSFLKLVAERGVWDDDLLRDAELAWASGTPRGQETAMIKWWLAAERGSEIAQNNLAHVLDQDKSILRLTRFSPTTPSNDTARLALTQWTRAAAQRNIDALVKVGDYYYHGLGVAEDAATRLEKAARYYQSAADTQLSALAMWNLGWMYENGVGVPQDFHLAKRHYDLALETNSEAYLPVLLSLGKLYVRSIWHTLLGGTGGLNIWNLDDDDESAYGQTRDARELDGPAKDAAPAEQEEKIEEDGPWYIGKAKDDFHRRRRGEEQQPRGDEEDPIEWARERRNSDSDRDGDLGPEDYFDGALRGGHRGEEDVNEFGETMVLVLLCLAVSILLYVRTRLVDRMRRDQRQAQQNEGAPAANAGVFPPVGDPAREDWAIVR